MVRAAVVVAGLAVGVWMGTAGVVGAPVGARPPVPAPVPAPVDGGAPGPPPVRTGPGAREAPAGRFLLPLDAPVVVARPFDEPRQRWAPGHRGVDLVGHAGQAVRAPGAGVVTFAGTVVDRGVVTVTHDGGLRSSLEPVDPTVVPGQRVGRGQPVGSIGTVPGHCAPATCLHWGLRRGETYLDPMQWVVDRGPVVLLPEG